MRLDTIVIDCRDKHALAEFWCALLGTTVRGELGQYLGLHPTPDGNARLVFQQVADPAPGRGRVHLDLDSHDVDADTERAVALGATVENEVEDFGMRWRTLSDPEGNLFCLVPAG
ncbi:MAG TPA: VOC family protein [Mycobacteriales bacterium]|jgi:predicted enzyme related to lactoylglutathione lyase|nr:VOC family protein [Mycobacteriales bacterium]